MHKLFNAYCVQGPDVFKPNKFYYKRPPASNSVIYRPNVPL